MVALFVGGKVVLPDVNLGNTYRYLCELVAEKDSSLVLHLRVDGVGVAFVLGRIQGLKHVIVALVAVVKAEVVEIPPAVHLAVFPVEDGKADAHGQQDV